jgi:hypothetical protein
MSLRAELLSGEFREMEVTGDREEMPKKDLSCEKKTS